MLLAFRFGMAISDTKIKYQIQMKLVKRLRFIIVYFSQTYSLLFVHLDFLSCRHFTSHTIFRVIHNKNQIEMKNSKYTPKFITCMLRGMKLVFMLCSTGLLCEKKIFWMNPLYLIYLLAFARFDDINFMCVYRIHHSNKRFSCLHIFQLWKCDGIWNGIKELCLQFQLE